MHPAQIQATTDWPTFWVQAITGAITLGALIVAIIGTYRATKQSRVSALQAAAAQAYIERRDSERAQREADDLARTLASEHAVFVYVRATWISTDRPWPTFSMSVTTDRDDVFYLQSVSTARPLRMNEEIEELVIYPLPGASVGQLISNGIPWERDLVQVHLPLGSNLPIDIPLNVTFKDVEDNLWRLDSNRGLTLLTPRRITSSPA